MANYFIIKMYPQVSVPQLELLTGGWMPVSQVVRGEAAVCVFTDHAKASAYQSNYQQVAMGQFRSMEVASMSASEIGKLKLISNKLTMAAVDPRLDFGQFVVDEIKPISEFGSQFNAPQAAVSHRQSEENLGVNESDGLSGGEVAGVIFCWPYSIYLFFKSLKEYPKKSKQICIIYVIFFVIGVLIQLAQQS